MRETPERRMVQTATLISCRGSDRTSARGNDPSLRCWSTAMLSARRTEPPAKRAECLDGRARVPDG